MEIRTVGQIPKYLLFFGYFRNLGMLQEPSSFVFIVKIGWRIKTLEPKFNKNQSLQFRWSLHNSNLKQGQYTESLL